MRSLPRTLRRGRLLAWVGALLLLGFLLLNVLAFVHVGAMTRFSIEGTRTANPEDMTWGQRLAALLTGINLPHPPLRKTPRAVGLDYADATIPSAATAATLGGGKLAAWIIEAPLPKGTVIGFHGYAAAKDQLLVPARRFVDLGWTVILVDFPGSGGSPGTRTTIGYHEADAVAAAVRWAVDTRGERAPVLYGLSMGAAAVLRAVGVLHVAPRAIVVEASFDRMATTVRHRFELMGAPSFPAAELLLFWGGLRMGVDAFAHDPVEAAAGVRCPALVLHGARDQRVTVAEAGAIHDALAGPRALHVFPEAGHEASAAVSAAEWSAVVAPFLDSLGPSSPPEGRAPRPGGR